MFLNLTIALCSRFLAPVIPLVHHGLANLAWFGGEVQLSWLLPTGCSYLPPTDNPRRFTTVYFHLILEAEVQQSTFITYLKVSFIYTCHCRLSRIRNTAWSLLPTEPSNSRLTISSGILDSARMVTCSFACGMRTMFAFASQYFYFDADKHYRHSTCFANPCAAAFF